jgi:hypothetical protein
MYSTTLKVISDSGWGASVTADGARMFLTDSAGDDPELVQLDLENGDRTIGLSDRGDPRVDPSGHLIASLARKPITLYWD